MAQGFGHEFQSLPDDGMMTKNDWKFTEEPQDEASSMPLMATR